MPSSPQGLASLSRQVKNTPDYPTVAIGGISIERVPHVLATGVGSVAVVSAITLASDWQRATAQLLHLIEGKELADENDQTLSDSEFYAIAANCYWKISARKGNES